MPAPALVLTLLRRQTHHHAVDDFGDTVLVPVPVQPGPIPEHLLHQLGLLVAEADLGAVAGTDFEHSAELDESRVVEHVPDVQTRRQLKEGHVVERHYVTSSHD